MLKVGLTGGIGSGKSTVAKVFQSLGVPIYFADTEARKFLYAKGMVQLMLAKWGVEVLRNEQVDRAFIASIVFQDKNELQWLNDQIHPLLIKDFDRWCSKQSAPYVIQEAAILFEAGFDVLFDQIISVEADRETRIERVMGRDNLDREAVVARIEMQWSDAKRREKSTHIISNENHQKVLSQVLEMHQEFIRITLSKS